MRFSDEHAEISFELSAGWSPAATTGATWPTAIRLQREGGLLEITMGDAPPGFSERARREDAVRQVLERERFGSMETAGAVLGGEEDCFRVDARRGDIRHVVVCALHDEVLYLIRYSAGDLDRGDGAELRSILRSFSFPPPGALARLRAAAPPPPPQTRALALEDLASRARKAEDWNEASRHYEEILTLDVPPADRAATFANLMQMHEKLGDYRRAATAAAAAYELIQRYEVYRTKEGAFMRGAVRGFLMRIRDLHADALDDETAALVARITSPAIAKADMFLGNWRAAAAWTTGAGAFAAMMLLMRHTGAWFDGVALFCMLTLSLALVATVRGWLDTFQRHVRFRPVLAWDMLRFTWISVRAPMVAWTLGTLLWSVATAAGESRVPIPAWYLAGSGIHLLLQVALPPIVLFLGASGESADVARRLAKSFNPMRVADLLRRRGSLRTLDGERWREVVRRFAESVPHIVADARFDSPAVREEVSLVVQYGQRTWLIVRSDGSSPVLDALPEWGSASKCVLVREDQLEVALRNLRDYGRP